MNELRDTLANVEKTGVHLMDDVYFFDMSDTSRACAMVLRALAGSRHMIKLASEEGFLDSAEQLRPR
ncbi:MAG: hypothetical protein R8M38_08465 [Mariprofundaceae bacterium]